MIDQMTAPAAHRTDRLFSLLTLERKAAAALSHLMADIGDQLIQIHDEILADGGAWRDWLALAAREAAARGLHPLSERTAAQYMALARFRRTSGERFPLFMHLDVACLYPVLTLPDPVLEEFQSKGIPTPGGERVPLADATARQVAWAASEARGPRPAGPARPAAPPCPTPPATRDGKFALALKLLDECGELTDGERSLLLDRMAPAEAQITPAAPAAPGSPVSAYALFGPVSVLNGRVAIGGTPSRTELADSAIAGIKASIDIARRVESGTGKLAVGRKTLAKTLSQQLWLALVKWPAMT
jgi:hypothetical protein